MKIELKPCHADCPKLKSIPMINGTGYKCGDYWLTMQHHKPTTYCMNDCIYKNEREE